MSKWVRSKYIFNFMTLFSRTVAGWKVHRQAKVWLSLLHFINALYFKWITVHFGGSCKPSQGFTMFYICHVVYIFFSELCSKWQLQEEATAFPKCCQQATTHFTTRCPCFDHIRNSGAPSPDWYFPYVFFFHNLS